jgi:CO/xanthine dehydrogenase Mo-binding subunit
MEAMVGIGVNVQRKDAFDKINGTTKYNMDYTSPGLLHAKMLTSPYAHARIKSIDILEAQRMPGVKAVITGQAFPGLVGVLYEDRPVLAQDKVRYYGEPVAVVVAETLYEAMEATRRIKVEYQPLPVVNSVTQAVKPDSPLVHEDMSQYRILKSVYPKLNTNIASHFKIRKGNISQGWAESEITLEETFMLPQGDHVAMEPRNVRAEIKADGKVIIHTSSQSPFMVRKLISRYFGVNDGKVVVITPAVGGAFGGKAAIQLEFIAYLATRAVGGRMVKLANTREEDMITSPVRIGLEAKIKLGASRDGTLKAAEITYLVDTGAYSDMGVGITKSIGADCTGPYKIENVLCDSICVYTNHPYATSFRGFGHAEYTFAIERALDLLAFKLNLDPLELRIKNAIAAGDTNPTQVELTTSKIGDLKQCLYELRKMIRWDEGHRTDLGNNKIRATGIGCFWKTPSTPTDAISSAVITFNPDGSVNLYVGCVELGTGTKTILAQILAERLKMDVNNIHVTMEVNTEISPVHWKTVASMTTYMVGRAVLEAADDAIKQLISIASIALRYPPQDLGVAGGRVTAKDNSHIFLDITEIAYGYKYPNGNAIGGQIMGHGTFIMKHLTMLDKETGKGNPGPAWTVGAQAVEVEFDTVECSYKILKAVSVIDIGKIMNPEAAKGVVKGGMSMGLSLARSEGFLYSNEGLILNANLRTYRIMHLGEEPEYMVHFIETPQMDAPFGARGIGEHGDLAMPAALANSLSSAASVNINQLPITPEFIWKRRKERDKG